jgi:hypothetical protein
MLDSANAIANQKYQIKLEQNQQEKVLVLKKEIKQEPQDPLEVKLEASLNASLNASLVAGIKQEEEEQQCNNKTWPPAPIKQERPVQVPHSPILAQSGGPGSGSDMQMVMVMTKLADMTALIQTQRAEMQVYREEMRELRREDVGQLKSILDESTTEATNEMRKSANRDTQNLLSGMLVI